MVNERMVELFEWFSGERTLLHATLIHAELGCLGFHQVHGAEIKTGQNLYRSGGECTAKKKASVKKGIERKPTLFCYSFRFPSAHCTYRATGTHVATPHTRMHIIIPIKTKSSIASGG